MKFGILMVQMPSLSANVSVVCKFEGENFPEKAAELKI